MDLIMLDTQFRAVDTLETYESVIWTDRYYNYGDFELYIPVSNKIMSEIKQDYYLWSSESEHMMIIEDIEIDSSVEEGNYVIITGRSLESILDRRIVWAQTTLDGKLQGQIQKILNDAIISPSDSKRKIDNFIFQESTDEYISNITIQAQYTGDNVLDVIRDACQANDIGFKIVLNSDNRFVFSLYYGEDRSYAQESNPYVVFSPNFENIINSNYIDSKKTYKSITLVAGEGEGSARKTLEVVKDELTGLNRRELFTDARDISSKVDNRDLTTAEYNALLKTRGEEKLAENYYIRSFDGEVEATQIYKYGTDFFMGDTVQLENEYGMESKARIIEFIHSESRSGISKYPTFKVIDEDNQ